MSKQRIDSSLMQYIHVLIVTILVAGTWILFSAEFNPQEAIAAIVAGLATGMGGYVLRKQTRHKIFGFRLWLKHLPSFFAGGLTDCWVLTKMLFRMVAGYPSRSTFKKIPFDTGVGKPVDTGRLVLATYGITLQPNSYVVGFNKDRDEMLIHLLDPNHERPIKEDIRRPS